MLTSYVEGKFFKTGLPAAGGAEDGLKTTNAIENLNSLVEDYIGRVKRWHHSEQRARWFALGLLEAEQRINRITGYKQLPKLRDALQRELNLKEYSEKEPLSQ